MVLYRAIIGWMFIQMWSSFDDCWDWWLGIISLAHIGPMYKWFIHPLSKKRGEFLWPRIGGSCGLHWSEASWELTIPICSMYGIFTYKTGWFLKQMLVNIPYMKHMRLELLFGTSILHVVLLHSCCWWLPKSHRDEQWRSPSKPPDGS